MVKFSWPGRATVLCLLLAIAPSSASADEGAAVFPDDNGVTALEDLTGAALEELLARDPTARLDARGRLLFADRHATTLTGPEAPSRQVAPLGKTFTLHSRPGSKRVIHLDFDGERVCNTAWNDSGLLGPILGGGLACGNHPGFKGNTGGGFSKADKRAIQEVWARVSEDFAPFDVDVTTQRPARNALERTNTSDKSFGVHAVVSSSAQVRNSTCGGPGCAGVAYVGIFDDPQANDARILWAFPEELGNSPRRLADVISHEAGHTLGLNHDGQGNLDYYGGHGIWAPIMGSSDRHLTQWSRGEYAGATETQDDLAVLAQNGIPRLADDHAANKRKAKRIRRAQPVSGVIGTSADVDAFVIKASCRAKVKVKARNADLGPNLDLRLTVKRPRKPAQLVNPLSSASGTAGGLDATWQGKGRPGTWLVKVAGTGARNPASTGYSGYGSLGRYTLKVTGKCVRR
ncbi:hypothetical protein [Nocardioides alcanivorans]|uniref:hypothetical protein n=1 Tax=Nocardioides alcanivorans TaxID=2897352 RepID=UPI001F2B7262|nr:hypothetical protein [Nocardioides alcanivorans]